MPTHRPNSRRTPDWQIGIDHKGIWLVPWGIFSALLLTSLTTSFSPGIIYQIQRNIVCEFQLGIATDAILRGTETMTVRIDGKQNVQFGDTIINFSRGEHSQHMLWTTDPSWRQQIRTRIQAHVKNHPKTSAIVIRVAPNVQLDVIASVCASAQSVSTARHFLEVIKE